MSLAKKIICIGGVTIDRKLKSIDELQLGTSNPVSSMSTFGGVAHNVAKNLAQLTDNIHLHSIVGSDTDGQKIIADLKKSGIATNHILIAENQTTAHYQVILNQEGELFLALADMDIFDVVPLDQFTQSWSAWDQDDLVFLDTNLPSTVIERAIQLANVKNVTLCIDPVSVTKAKKLPMQLDNVFLIKPDRLEAEILTKTSIHSIADCIKAGKLLLDKGVKNCIISLGKLGYVIVNQTIQTHFPAIAVDSIVDVSGAGDAFIAGVLYELKQGSPIVDACQMGAAAAAMTVQSYHTVNDAITLASLTTLQKKQATMLKQRKIEENYAAIF